jgi:hypothetical protein
MYKAKVLVLPEDTVHRCGRLRCREAATFFVTELREGQSPINFAYCELHYNEYANNGLLEVSIDDPHNRLDNGSKPSS